MNRYALFDAMVTSKVVTLKDVVGRIQSIQMEDGSGYCFNVTMSVKNPVATTATRLFVTTAIDEQSAIRYFRSLFGVVCSVTSVERVK